jgi:hypothetical protein
MTMSVKSLSTEELGFYRGILIGLHHAFIGGHDDLYRELIREVGPGVVVAVAREDGDLHRSGLIKYKWCDKNGRYTPCRVLR